MKKIIIIIITFIIIITIITIIDKNKNQETKIQTNPSASTPVILPEEWNLEKELESVDPKVLDSDFNE